MGVQYDSIFYRTDIFFPGRDLYTDEKLHEMRGKTMFTFFDLVTVFVIGCMIPSIKDIGKNPYK
jgi:hypothetical protein